MLSSRPLSSERRCGWRKKYVSIDWLDRWFDMRFSYVCVSFTTPPAILIAISSDTDGSGLRDQEASPFWYQNILSKKGPPVSRNTRAARPKVENTLKRGRVGTHAQNNWNNTLLKCFAKEVPLNQNNYLNRRRRFPQVYLNLKNNWRFLLNP